MQILVTGATGFIGRHCLPLLVRRGYQVHAVTSKSKLPLGSKHISWHHANLLNSVQLAKLVADVQPTHLLHLAWYAVPGKFWTSLENVQWVQASLGLMQEFCVNNGKRAVMAGTCAEYDWKFGHCSEQNTPLVPATMYGACKHSLQVMLNAFSQQTGLSSAWGRVFHTYGAYEHPSRLVASVIRCLLLSKPAYCSHGQQVRDFLHVERVASALVALLDSDIQGPVNIASGRPVSVKELVEKIGEKIGRSDLIRLGEGSLSENDPPLLVADTGRLHNELRWRAVGNLDDDLSSTISWWISRLEGGSFEDEKEKCLPS